MNFYPKAKMPVWTAMVFLACVLLSSAGCSSSVKETASAIIRVTYDPPEPPDFFIVLESEVLRSHLYLSHVDEVLGLAKAWGLSRDQAVEKLRQAIQVEPGSEADLVVIKTKGLEHGLAVKILAELCNFSVKKQITSSNDGHSQTMRVSIVQPAS